MWLAKGTKLYHFGPQGQLLQSLTLDQNARDLAVDPDTDRVWVATEGRVLAFEDGGLPIAPLPVDLGKNRASGDDWMAWLIPSSTAHDFVVLAPELLVEGPAQHGEEAAQAAAPAPAPVSQPRVRTRVAPRERVKAEAQAPAAPTDKTAGGASRASLPTPRRPCSVGVRAARIEPSDGLREV